ncbi:MAG: polysaccharide biosynthesis tyrosine autokinase [Acidobacteriota bacterium]|nr:polysaccharide biosynthesis tyrosine autokinase [Acidobacteriota bacterium]
MQRWTAPDLRSSPESVTSEWSLQRVRRVLWNRRWLALTIAAEVFLVTGLVTVLKTPEYRASSRVLIERSIPKVLESEDVVPIAFNEFEIGRYYQTQYLLIRDPAVLANALDKYGIRAALIGDLFPEDGPDEDVTPPSDEELAEDLADRIRIKQQDFSNVVEVSFQHPQPEVAANVVNAALEAYRDFFVTSGIDARRGATQFLNDRLEEAQAEVLALEKDLAHRRVEIRDVLTASGTEIGITRLEGLDRVLTEAKAKRAAAEARVAALAESLPLDLPEVRGDERVARYREELRRLESELALLEGKVGPAWPRVVELRAAAETTRRGLVQVVEELYIDISGSARGEVANARESERRLAGLLDRELARAADGQLHTADFESLRSEYEQKKAGLSRLLQRREEVALSADLENILARQVTILAPALPPLEPAVPRVGLNLLLGLVLGLMLGLSSGFVAEAMDNKIRTPDQLQEIAGVALLGSIPRIEAQQRPRLVFSRKSVEDAPALPTGQQDVEEAFRALRSALLLARPEHPPRSIMITSALPGEGKSTIVANLGRTLAAFGHKVVLIDADLRKPRLHRVFGTGSARGLANALASTDVRVGELIVETGFANLLLIPGGPCPPDPATLLDPHRLHGLIDELTREMGFDFVIVDTPPVLVFSDAFNIVPLVEGTIVVGRAERTTKEAARQAVAALGKLKARFLGVVLNGEVSEEHSGSYYRYHHYRKHHDDQPSAEENRPATQQPRRASGE